MRLGFILEPGAANSNYRAIFPMRAMQARGHEVLWPERLGGDVPFAQLATCQLVHCYRRPDRTREVRLLRERGVAVSFDNDDDFSAAAGDGRERLGNARRSTELLRLARLADVVTTPSAVLAERYRGAGVERVEVIGNHLDPEALGGLPARAAHEGIVLGWMAGTEHAGDLDALPIVAVLEQLLQAHPQLRVVTIGVRLALRSGRYEYRGKVPFGELLRALADFDIGIAPLADTPFNQARSDVKLKEYAAAGVPWLASPVGAYPEVGEKAGGQLVGEGEWFQALDRLIRSGLRRRRLARQALRWARGQTIERHAGEWETVFAQAIERSRARAGAHVGV